MAFADWPTSDGHNMLLYPWLNDIRHTDRFAEHGHRLAGMVIGVVTIALVAITFLRERQRWVRMYSIAILFAVIAQGLLGGARVLLDANVLAMVHSITGAAFFALCVVFALMTSRRWSTETAVTVELSVVSRLVVFLLPVLVLVQYWMGGMFRHMGRMMFEHLAGAAVVALAASACAILLMRTGPGALRRAGIMIGLALLFQLILGAGAWLTKLNVPALGWVASTGSLASVIFRSLHTVGGMALLTSTVVGAAQATRLNAWQVVANGLTNRGQEGLA